MRRVLIHSYLSRNEGFKILYKIIFPICLILFIIGCSSHKNTDKHHPSNNKNEIDQQYAEEAKTLLNKEDLDKTAAINTKEKLIIAIETTHFDRLKLAEIQKTQTKKMKESFPDLDVTLSTDKKIMIEVEKLEQEIKANKISQKEFSKKVKALLELEKEQT